MSFVMTQGMIDSEITPQAKNHIDIFAAKVATCVDLHAQTYRITSETCKAGGDGTSTQTAV